MKKCIVLTLSILLLAACTSIDAPDAPTDELIGTPLLIPAHPNDDPDLDPGMALNLREDYCRYLEERYAFAPTMDEVWVQTHIGDFSNHPVVYMGSPLDHTAALRPVAVAGYAITFGSGQLLYVYDDGKFYTLNEAYDAALITEDDVCVIGAAVDPTFSENSTSDAP